MIHEKYPELLFTPRNLQMLCFRSKENKASLEALSKVSASSSLPSNKSVKLSVALSVYDELSPSMSKLDRKEFRARLEEQFGLESNKLKEVKVGLKAESFRAPVKSMALSEGNVGDGAAKFTEAAEALAENRISDFRTKVVQSRQNSVRMFDQLMFARERKQEDKDLADKGLSGIIITGEAGIGKSYLARKYLESRGFSDKEDAKKKFYHIATTKYEEVEKILLQAFHEGAVVIIDEINTMPLEKLLNPLLSGVDLQGHSATKAGFTILGTQNPAIGYSHRIKFSDALKNRFQEYYLKDYKKEELNQLLEQKGLKKDSINDLLKEYQRDKMRVTPRELFANADKRKGASHHLM